MPNPTRTLLLLVLGVGAAACDFNLTSPTPTQQTQTTNVTVTPPPTPPTPPTPTVPTPPATGTPPGTAPQPLPANAQGIAAAYAAQYPALLAASCQATSGPAAWQYLDGLVAALRATDQRWGYVCRYGACSDISADVIAYLGGGGTPVRGAQGTWGVDVITNHCAANPTAGWNVLGYDPTGVWSPTR